MVDVIYSEAVLSVLGWALGWSSFYVFLCQVDTKRSNEWHCRMVTVCHAVLISALSAYCCLVQGPWPFTHPGGPSTPLQQAICIIALGYFFFDFSWCLYFQTEGCVMLMHHCLSIIGIGVTVLRGMYGTEMIATLLGSEITNPLLQLRWFLRDSNQYDTKLAEINDWVFMILFGIMRIGVGSYLLYCYMVNPVPDIFGRIGGICIYSIGWIFMISIVRFAIRKTQGKYKVVSSTEKASFPSNGNVSRNGAKRTKAE